MDETGTLTDTYDYTAFGELYAQTGTTPNNYLYTGQQYDEVTGLYSLRARYYNPADGRFLSRDTYQYDYDNPIELNRYLYAANAPTNGYDPTGFLFVSYSKQNESSVEEAAALQTERGIILNFAQGSYEAYTYSLYTRAISGILLGLFLSSLLSISLLSPYVPPPHTPDLDTDNPPAYNPPNPYDPPDYRDPDIPPTPDDRPYTPPRPDTDTSTDPNVPPMGSNEHSNYATDAEAPPLPDSAPDVEREEETNECNPKTDPSCDSTIFDIALGVGDTLKGFSNSFTDRPTLYFREWPDFMVLKSPNNPKSGYLDDLIPTVNVHPQATFGAVKIAMDRWNSQFPEGKIKFNLSGITARRKVTLLELRYVLSTYAYKAEFYTFPPQKRLAPNEVSVIITNLAQYFDDL